MQKHFNKNFVMTEEEEHFSQTILVGFVINSWTMKT